MRVKIAGKYWQLKFVRSITNGGVACDGLCDAEKREIRIRKDLKGQEMFDTLIHELGHALAPHADEQFVTDSAADIAQIIYNPAVRGRL